MKLKDALGILKGKNRYETLENYSILFIIIGAGILTLGIGLSAINPKGISAVLAMLGSLISFLFTIILILVWLMRGTDKEETGEISG
jgi:hypothetical protein